ncbi:hypothetical protein [Halorubellus sp. PRR65]|nr:hypothetical protein [Halorubellus sp. PRR65]
MNERDSPRTTRARTGLALFGAVFGFGGRDDALRADGGDED